MRWPQHHRSSCCSARRACWWRFVAPPAAVVPKTSWYGGGLWAFPTRQSCLRFVYACIPAAETPPGQTTSRMDGPARGCREQPCRLRLLADTWSNISRYRRARPPTPRWPCCWVVDLFWTIHLDGWRNGWQGARRRALIRRHRWPVRTVRKTGPHWGLLGEGGEGGAGGAPIGATSPIWQSSRIGWFLLGACGKSTQRGGLFLVRAV